MEEFKVLIKYWKSILIAPILVMIVATVLLLKTPERYEVSAEVFAVHEVADLISDPILLRQLFERYLVSLGWQSSDAADITVRPVGDDKYIITIGYANKEKIQQLMQALLYAVSKYKYTDSRESINTERFSNQIFRGNVNTNYTIAELINILKKITDRPENIETALSVQKKIIQIIEQVIVSRAIADGGNLCLLTSTVCFYVINAPGDMVQTEERLRPTLIVFIAVVGTFALSVLAALVRSGLARVFQRYRASQTTDNLNPALSSIMQKLLN